MSLKDPKTIFYMLLAFLSAGLFILALEAPIDVDEILHNGQAKKVVHWFATGGADTTCLDTPKSFLKYYGQSVDNLAAAINHVFHLENEYQTRHIIGWGIGVLLLLVTGLLAIEISGSYGLGSLVMMMLFFSPRPMGQVLDNLKDLPFALGYAWSLLCLIRLIKEMPVLHWRTAIMLGIAIGFTNSVRIGGLVVFPITGLFILLWIGRNYSKEQTRFLQANFWFDLIKKGLVILLIGYFGGLLFWPFGLINPLLNPFESLFLMQNYAISIRQVFEGQVFWSTSLPWTYLLKWMWISIPEIVWVGLGLMLLLSGYGMVLKKRKLDLVYSLLWFVLLFPMIYVILIQSNLYSGWRQMYFVYVPMLLLSSLGFYRLWQLVEGRMAKYSLLLLLMVGIAFPVSHFFRNKPLHYIYFNQFAGGNEACWNNYEYDYYWMGVKEAADFLKKELKLNDNVRLVSNFNISPYFYNNLGITLSYVRYQERASVPWDYAILGVNYIHPEQIKNDSWKPGNIIKTVYHAGHPVAVVLKNSGNEGAKGILAAKEERFDDAVVLYNQLLQHDPNNLDIIAKKASALLQLKRATEFEETVNSGLRFHPFYEPFYLLRVKSALQNKEYEEAIRIGEALLQINKRYNVVLPLLKEAYENSNDKKKASKIDQYLIKYGAFE